MSRIGDTSKINKNPLLSAGTGLNFEDFSHNAVLMPAAPVAKLEITDNSELKPVIYEAARGDTAAEENFSDISLEPTSSANLTVSFPKPINPLEDIDPFDNRDTDRGNQFQSDGRTNQIKSGTEMILSQASNLTASFQQTLPTVASTVFSTFSNILKTAAGQEMPEQPTGADSSMMPSTAPHQYTSPLDELYNYQMTHQNPTETVTQTPLFISPQDAPGLQSSPSGPPPVSNTFRLGGQKKKIYAPVPGLSAGAHQTSSVEGIPPVQMPPMPIAPQPTTQESHFHQPHLPEAVNTSQMPTYAPPAPEIQQDPYSYGSGGNLYSAPQQQVNQDYNEKPQSKFSLSSFFSNPILERFQGKPQEQQQQSYEPFQQISSSTPYQQQQPPSVQQQPAFINPAMFNTNPVSNPPQVMDQNPMNTAASMFQPMPSVTPPVQSFGQPPLASGPPVVSPNVSTSSIFQPMPSVTPPTTFIPPVQTFDQPPPAGSPCNITGSSIVPPKAGIGSGYRMNKGRPVYAKPNLIAESHNNAGFLVSGNVPPPTGAVNFFNPVQSDNNAMARPISVSPKIQQENVPSVGPSGDFATNVGFNNQQSIPPVPTMTPQWMSGPSTDNSQSEMKIPPTATFFNPQITSHVPEVQSNVGLHPPVSELNKPQVPTYSSETFNVPTQESTVAPITEGLKMFNPQSFQQPVMNAPRVESRNIPLQEPPTAPIMNFFNRQPVKNEEVPKMPPISVPSEQVFDLQNQPQHINVPTVQNNPVMDSFNNPPTAPPSAVSSASSTPAPLAPPPTMGFYKTKQASVPKVELESTGVNSVPLNFFNPIQNQSTPGQVQLFNPVPVSNPTPIQSQIQQEQLPTNVNLNNIQPAVEQSSGINFFNMGGNNQTDSSNFFNPIPQPESIPAKIESSIQKIDIFTPTTENVKLIEPRTSVPSTPVDVNANPEVSFEEEITPEKPLISQVTDENKNESSQDVSAYFSPTTEDFFNNNSRNSSDNKGSDDHSSFFDSPPELKPSDTLNNQSLFQNFMRAKLSAAAKINEEETAQQNQSLLVEAPSRDDTSYSISSFPSFDQSTSNFPEMSLQNNQPTEESPEDEIMSGKNGSTNDGSKSPPNVTGPYRPVYTHWFFKQTVNNKARWSPMSMTDSMALEEAYSTNTYEDRLISTDGGRHDVDIKARKRTAVYWSAEETEVRRCSWFYKGVDSRFVPYEENTAEVLEQEYKEAYESNTWHRKVTLPSGEMVNFHGPNVIVHFIQTGNDSWGNSSSQAMNRPRTVKRGVDEFNIEDGEPEKIDHVLFMVHGIGAACDLRFRSVEEVVEEFRSIAHQMVQSHYRSSYDSGEIGRIEVLPISWHSELHSEESGIDAKLKAITLDSIPKIRTLANETILDVLFYTSPKFCQHIHDIVAGSINRMYNIFLKRHPNFQGEFSLAGHSLGSLILFDLLYHQKQQESQPENREMLEAKESPLTPDADLPTNYQMGHAGTGQPFINYPQLNFPIKNFFALGSPIGMFVTVRGIDTLGLDFKLPTCDRFYNIFHPFDPVAYRIESLVNPDTAALRPVLIPHHKGRKRMHLELRETVERVKEDVKTRIINAFKSTFETMTNLKNFNKTDDQSIATEVDKVLDEQLRMDQPGNSTSSPPATPNNTSANNSEVDVGETDLPLGRLNQGHRIDYVLQEAPLEFFNGYLFALTSHVCYWESEDTTLFVVKEIYSSMNVQSDNKIPQHSLTIERPVPAPTASTSNYSLFRDAC